LEESKNGSQNDEENINNVDIKEDENFEESEKDRVYAK